MRSLGILAAISLLLSSCSKSINSTEVYPVSAMKKVMMGEDLSQNIKWDTLNKDFLFAVAPLGRIEGEVTIIDGEMFVSSVGEDQAVIINNSWDITSPFAVYTFVENWTTYKHNLSISSEDELQEQIELIAEAHGYDLDNDAFAFRLKGHFNQLDYHIISKPKDEQEHNHELHKKAKKHYYLTDVDGELIGFYSRNHEGIFTHKGSYVHVHFVSSNKDHAGHIENLEINAKVEILLPTK
ncbi:MAG: hypothetical protein EA358_10805 [Flavobacteriales bacterium]|nr:MAG: hypothetical protein EA358_10805 [Flavobacteriales bacterium]